jgi:flagella basal body P-ring formation protein FlgA
LKPDTNVLTSFEEAIGKTSVRPIQAGNVILSRMIEIPPLVTKGDRVLIKAESDEIRITTMGEVLEDGRSGDQVRVININSGKEISAKVTGPGLVEVYF